MFLIGAPPLFSRRRRSFVYTDTQSQGTNLTNRTFSGMNLGDPSQDRLIVVATTGYRNIAFTNTITVAGVSATSAVATGGAGSADSLSLHYASVPTGSTGTIQVNCSTNIDTLRIMVFALYGLLSHTPVATDSQGPGSSPSSVSTTFPQDSVLIGAASNRVTGGTYTLGGTSGLLASSQGAANVVDMVAGGALILNGGASLTSTSSHTASYSNNKYVQAYWR